MAERLPPGNDNPIQDIFQRVLGQNKTSRSVSDKLESLVEKHLIYGTRIEGRGYTNLLSAIDPLGISNYAAGDYKITSDISEIAELRGGRFSREARSVAQKAAEFLNIPDTAQGVFLYNKTRNALFVARREIGSDAINFADAVAIPVPGNTLRPNTLNIGYNQVSVNDAFWATGETGLRSGSTLQALYSNLSGSSGTNLWSKLKRVRDIELGTTAFGSEAATLGRLSDYSGSMRGMPFGMEGSLKAASLRNVFFKDDAVLQKIISQRSDASAALNILTRQGYYRGIEELFPFLEGSSGFTEAFTRSENVLKDFPAQLTSRLAALGVLDQYPLVKPEFLADLGAGQVKIPSGANLISTDYLPQRYYEKGLYQEFNVGYLQPNQIERLGGRSYAPFYTEDYYKAGYNTVGGLNRGRPYNVAVVDFADKLDEALWFQDSGSIITARGLRGEARQLPSGTAKFAATASSVQRLKVLFSSKGVNFTGKDVDVAYGMATGYNKIERLQRLANPDTARIAKIERALAKKQKALTDTQRQLLSVMSTPDGIQNYGMLRNAGIYGYQVGGFNIKQGKVAIDFVTRDNIAPAANELVIGGVRTTAVYSASGSRQAKLSQYAASRGADILMSSTDFEKMYSARVVLENAFSTARSKGMMGRFVSAINKQAGSTLVSMGPDDIPILRSFGDTVENATAVLRKWRKSRDSRKSGFANRALFGQEIAPGVRMFTAMGGARADFMMDINAAKPVGITLSKLNTMARHSRALGMSPRENPIFNLFYGALRSKRAGIRLTSEGTFVLSKNSGLSKAARVLMGSSENIDSNSIVRITGEGTFVGNRQVTSISDAIRSSLGPDAFTQGNPFGFKQGGVPFSALENTLLGRNNPRMMYLDLGEKRKFTSYDGNTITSRYMPLPMDMANLRRGIEGNLVLSGKHTGRSIVSSLMSIEDNYRTYGDIGNVPSRTGTALEDLYGGVRGVFLSLARGPKGQRGRLEKKAMIRDRFGTRARLVPQRGGRYTRENFTQNLFEVEVDKLELEDILNRKRGQVSEKGINRIRRNLNDKGYTYALMTADPTQRGEHQLLVKLTLAKGTRAAGSADFKSQVGIGQLNLSANPVLFRMLERDTDRDVVNLHLLEGHSQIMRKNQQKRLAKMYDAQQKAAEPFAAWHKYELLSKNEPVNYLRNFFSSVINKFSPTKDNMAAYISQKAQAHYGYTITRAMDRFIDSAMFGTQDIAINSYGAGLVGEVRASADPIRAGIASNLAQELFQGGVAKGKEAPLTDLAKGLGEFRERVKASPQIYNRQQMIDETAPLFENYLRKVGKRREFMAMNMVLKEAGYSQEAISLVEQDLIRETTSELSRQSKKRISDASEASIRGTARFLAEYIGVGYGIQPFVRDTENIMGVIQDQASNIGIDDKRFVTKILTPLAGGESNIGAGLTDETAEEIEKRIEKEAGETIASKAASVFSKRQLLVGGLIGAGVAGVAFTALSEPGAPLPPPMNPSMPLDMNPIIPPSARLYGDNSVTPVGDPMYSMDSMSIGPGANPYSSMGQNQLFIRDKVSPINPGLMSLEMRKVANSDFNY